MEDNGYFIRVLFRKYATPSVIALVCSMSGTMINGVIGGQAFGNLGLAVISLCSSVYFIFTTLGALIGMGAANRAAKYAASDDFGSVSRLYTLSILLVFIVGVIAALLFFSFGEQIARFLSQDGALQQDVYRYLMYSLPFGFFVTFQYIPINFSRIDGKPNVGAYMCLFMACMNIFFNLLLIEYTKLGIEAIAIGSLLATICSCIIGTICVMTRGSHIRFKLSKTKEQIRNVFSYGSPAALRNLSNFCKVLIFNILLLSVGGNESVAIFSIVIAVNQIATAIMLGIGQAIIPLISVFYEEKDNTSVRQTVYLAFVFSGISATIFAILIATFPTVIGGLCGVSDPSSQEALKPALWFLAASLPIAAINNICTFYYMSISRIGMANILTVARGFVLTIFFAYVLSVSLGVNGIWLSILLAEPISFILVYICSVVCKKDNTSKLLMLNSRLESEGRYLSFSVDNNEESIVSASEKVKTFCSSNQVSSKQTMLISMSIEEIIMLLYNNGVSDRRYNAVAVRIFIMDGTIIIRFRNVGKKFNPIEYYNRNISTDIEKSLEVIGLKYIVGAAKNIHYRETFGINSLVVTI